MGGTLVAIVAVFIGWVYWLSRIVREDVRELREDMRTMGSGWSTGWTATTGSCWPPCGGHTHDDVSPPIFRELPDAAG